MADVVAIGELIIDFAPVSVDTDGYPTIAAKSGGATGNFAAACAKYAVSTYVIGKVGDDVFGKLLIGSLKKAGVETSGIIEDKKVFTTLAFVTIDETGDRSFSFSRKPGADSCLEAGEIDLSVIESAKILHFGSIPLTNQPCRTATKKAVEHAKNAGVLVLFDPNYRPPLWESISEAKEQMLWGLEQADIVKISEDEIDFLWGLTPEKGAEKILSDYNTKLVMATCGPQGAYLLNKTASVHVNPPLVKVVDTTGAGDVFAGSAIYRMLKLDKKPDELTTEDLTYIGKFAVTAASISTQTHGGLQSVPDEVEVLNLM